ncbi:MAG: ROK family protein, partial [Candidatus Eisenbacteria bacterium]|nr:ROK family protein [Candidatus Latescibacterota bacterium]MBD3302200.1 ROK family protein [Candidatus Eisenbacteria bacterium]
GPGLAAAYVREGGGRLAAEEIWTRAVGGDRLALQVTDRYKRRFGRAMAQVINILDPDRIVLGGGVSNAPGLAEEAADRIRPFLFNDEVRTRIVRHRLGDSAGVLGAAWLGGG